jgi:hypothetical protein
MRTQDLFHEVNNQLQIIVDAADTLSNQVEDPRSKERCTLIRTAATKISGSLHTYFKEPIASNTQSGGAESNQCSHPKRIQP